MLYTCICQNLYYNYTIYNHNIINITMHMQEQEQAYEYEQGRRAQSCYNMAKETETTATERCETRTHHTQHVPTTRMPDGKTSARNTYLPGCRTVVVSIPRMRYELQRNQTTQQISKIKHPPRAGQRNKRHPSAPTTNGARRYTLLKCASQICSARLYPRRRQIHPRQL